MSTTAEQPSTGFVPFTFVTFTTMQIPIYQTMAADSSQPANEQQQHQHQQQAFLQQLLAGLMGVPSMENWFQQQPQQQPQFTPPHASKQVMHSLKEYTRDTRLPKSHPFLHHDHDCAICQEKLLAKEDTDSGIYRPTEGLRELPCHHVYHEQCIFPWLERSNQCPTCRYELETDNEDYNRGVRERMASWTITPVQHECCLEEVGCCWKETTESTQSETDAADTLVTLACNHCFHAECLDASLHMDNAISNPTMAVNEGVVKCPRCRKKSSVPHITNSEQNA